MRVAVLGDVNLDVAVGVDALPAPAEEVFAHTSRIGLGGSAVNTAVVLVRVGLEAAILARVGDDVFGRFTLTELESVGIDTSGVSVGQGETTGLNLVTVTDDGERSMIAMRGANVSYQGGWVDGADWLHVSGYSLLEDPQRSAARAAVASAKQAGIPVSMDIPAGLGDQIDGLTDTLRGCRLVSSGGPNLAAFIDDPSSLALGRMAVTAGADVCRLVDSGESVELTPPRVDSVDATGAGDSFVAGLIAADLAGLDLGASLVAGATLGAAAVTHPGAGTALGRPDRVRSVLAAGPWIDADPVWLEQAATLFL